MNDLATATPVASPGLSVGLDIGGTKTLAVLLAPDGAVLAQSRLATEQGAAGVIDGAVRAVEGVTRQAGVPVSAVTGVGVGVPGLVDADDGTVRHAVNLGLNGDPLELAALLSDRLGGVGVEVENDLNAAAVGAAHLVEAESGSGATDLAFLALGTGLAAGLVLGGRLRRGASGAAGEIGHVPVDPAGPLCGCGQRGCLELYASGTAVSTMWPSRGDRPAPVELFDAAARGDLAAIAARDRYARAVAAAVRMLVLSVDVQHVVLGGGVAQLGVPLLDAVRSALTDESDLSPFLRSLDLPARVRLAPGRVPVGAVGAAVVGRGPTARATRP
ncbi:putative NBD/HSP70 family sugar kinase [Isoptericola jiangsuensis]|uniref:Putative NBD/HSP70 family sugar kinase n=1 Tax=Isoptericola jiangsuensis TaxID=548579 RepID=A0A2A9EVN0_9MICO|nr:ROK family protein [Isoptericola jiangsuensis]PFG42571.1 putative NBD/HSP70 family sugar kinase [Isoptericola jiangsuensis]